MVSNNIQRRVIELQEGKTIWSEFEKAILTEFATEDSTRMTQHALVKWIEKKNKKMSTSRVYDEFDQMFNRLPNTDQAIAITQSNAYTEENSDTTKRSAKRRSETLLRLVECL